LVNVFKEIITVYSNSDNHIHPQIHSVGSVAKINCLVFFMELMVVYSGNDKKVNNEIPQHTNADAGGGEV
jgi:hypothetical protein